MEHTVPSYRLEVREAGHAAGLVELISRGETRESGWAAYCHYMREDAYRERLFDARGPWRLVLTQGPTWLPDELHPENVDDSHAAYLLMPAHPRSRGVSLLRRRHLAVAPPVDAGELLDEADRIVGRDRFPWDEASDRVLAGAAALDPGDQSPEAEYLREVAGSVLDHRAAVTRMRAEPSR